jgi:hypothetical protein
MADQIFDERGAGLYLGGTAHPISARSLQRWRQDGRGPKFVRVGNLIRYRASDLEGWLSKRVARSTVDRVGEPR